jgi:cytochrome c peroxidase
MRRIIILYVRWARLCVVSALCLVALTYGCISEVEPLSSRTNALNLDGLPDVVHPAENASSESKVRLGKSLFWDPILSGEKDVACGTCHLPEYGYTDGLDLSIGVGGIGRGVLRIQTNNAIPPTPRNTPSIINSAYNGLINSSQAYDPLDAVMFWDGRKKSLEGQCVPPLSSFNAMRGNAYPAAVANDSIIQRLKKIPGYVTAFEEVFGPGESITVTNLAKAIAAFERSIVANNSPYDQYIRGNTEALTEQEQEGILLFFGKANCASCHSGPMFSDYNFYNLGVPYNNKIPADSGRNKAFLFRTPTLRNASLTAPYMHSGVYATLDEVLEHYNHGVSQNDAILGVDKKIKPLHLTAKEKQAIISFLQSLTDTQFDQEIPPTVPSGLNPGGNL